MDNKTNTKFSVQTPAISFTFGAYSRYMSREFQTRFGTTEWHVTDAETIDPVSGLPELIRQFSSIRDLINFVDATVLDARADGALCVAGFCSDDLGAKCYDVNGQAWEITMIDCRDGIVGVQDMRHEGRAGYKELPFCAVSI